MRSIRRPGRTIALAASAVFAVLLLTLIAPALAAASSTATNGNAVVRFQDYTLPQGQTVNSVVVIRGNAVIGGTVTRSVVVVGGNATIESTAVVGADQSSQSSSVVVVGGHLTTEPGATIHGKTTQVAGFHLSGVLRTVATREAVRPIGVLAGWWELLFLPIVALVVSALFPRAVRRVGERVRLGFWPSFGWGLLGLLIVGVLLLVLAITIVGLIVAVPVGFVIMPGALLFCFACVAALLGRLVLSSSERYRDNIIVAAVVGAVLVSLVSLVPVIGGLAVFVTTVVGFGAALTLLNEWREARQSSPAPAAGGPLPPAGTMAAPHSPPPPGWIPPPPGWIPPPGSAAPQGWTAPTGAPPAGWTPAPGWTAPPGWAQGQGWPASPGWVPAPGWTPPPGWTLPPGWAAPPGWTPPPAEGTSPAQELPTEAPSEEEPTAEPASEEPPTS